MPSKTAEQRSADARYAARISHLRSGGRKRTQAARDALWRRFLRAADPDGDLTERERERRAHLIRDTWYTYLRMQQLKHRRALSLAVWMEQHVPPPGKPVADPRQDG